MKKFIALVLALVMVFSVTVNVLAFTALDTTTAMETIRIDGKDGKYFYYDSTTGNVSVGATTTETGLGDLIMPEKVNADYAFTATTSGTTYHYQVLDEVVASNGKKQYYIYCNDLYGYGIGITPDNNVFDPSVEKNIAYWLNNAFYNGGTATTDGVVLDTNIKPYIVDHEWLVEANEAAPTGYPQTDYSVNCKIALLSISEYAKYAKKIGWGAYVNGSLTSSGFHMFLRSPVSNSTNLRTLYSSNGCTANIAVYNSDPTKFTANYGAARIRPAFYVSEDYFKNVKLDLNAAGSEVKKIISELNPSIYSGEELLSLKGIYTLTEDGSEALSTDEWTTNTAGATAENGVINLPGASGKWLGRSLPQDVKGGIINIEAEVIGDVAKNSLHIGLLYNNGTGPSFKYPLYLYDNGILGYYTEAKEQTGAKYQRLDNNSNDLWYTHFASPRTLRLTVNLDTGNCYVSVSGEKAGANTTANIRYSLGTTVVPYVDSTKTFSKIVFYNSSSIATTLDDIKITYDPNGNAIKSVEKTGDKEIEITVEDYVDLQSVTKDSICLTANTATAISVNGNKITATLANKLTNGDKCVIVNDMKRNDVGGANYTIIGNSALFTVTAPTETVIGAPVISGDLTSGTKVSATSVVTKGTSTAVKPVQFVIAAYNGDRLIGAKIESIENVNNVNELKAELTLSENATEIRAFIWDANNYPIRSAVSKDQ